MKPQIVNAKMNRLLFRGKVIKALVLAAVVFSVVMMTGYRKFDTTVLITDRGVTREIKTNESDVYEILRAENYELGEEDRVSYTKDDKEGHITIRRAFDVTVTADGETRTITTIGGKVEDILEKAGVTLGETDTIDPALDKSVSADTKITVTRIRYLERTTTAEIPFETEYVDDPNLTLDTLSSCWSSWPYLTLLTLQSPRSLLSFKTLWPLFTSISFITFKRC